MIVYKASLLASPPAGVSLNNARICYQTHLRDLDVSAVTASSAGADTPADAPLRPDTAEWWAPTALPATWTVALGGAKTVDYVGVAGHTIGSSGCALKVEWSPDNTNWTIFANEIAPADDAALLFLDDEVSAAFLRFTITGDFALPHIGSIYAGQQLAMQRTLYGGHTPLTLSRSTTLQAALSRGGQFLGQNYRAHGMETSAAWRFLTAAWIRSNFEPFMREARKHPFFFAWRPSDWPLEVGYCWATDDIRPNNMGKRDYMQVNFKMVAEGHE